MHFYQGRKYFDDRLFILDITVAQKDGCTTWAVVTRRNCEGIPPYRVDDFDTQEDAIAFIKEIEPKTPRFSLGENSPNPPQSYETYCQWLRAEGIPSSLESYAMNQNPRPETIIHEITDEELADLSEEDSHYGQQMNVESLRDRLCEVASKWEEKYRARLSIISAIAEFDAARIIGLSEEEYVERERGGRFSSGFIFREMRYRVMGTQRKELGERPGSTVIHKKPTNYDWDYLIWIRYNKLFVIEEVWRWNVVAYKEYFHQRDSMTLNDMRLGENLLRTNPF
jgi:hypothetical protein